MKFVETAVPFTRFVCTLTEVWLGKPAARSTPVLLMATNAAPSMPVVERPAPVKLGIDACVATAAHWVMS